VRVEQQQRPIVRRRADVVDEQSHADATISRAHHGRDQQLADRVVLPAVVLQVEAALGEIDEAEARKERIGTAGYQVDARRPVQLGQPAGGQSSERRRVGGISERRRRAVCVRLRK
jgi:hypothetical protein